MASVFRGWILLVCWVVLLIDLRFSVTGLINNCDREPPGVNQPKTPGDNGFQIVINGNPDKYTPGEVYIVKLKGWRTQYSVQKFKAFLLSVDQSVENLYDYNIPLNKAGVFQLFGDALTKFSDTCPNTVVQTSNFPKSEVQVLWQAPKAGSGCIQFKSMVVEQNDLWYMDDGMLTRELCEDVVDSGDQDNDILEECCACDEAKYELMFEGLWSRQTHPKDFPTNEWLTHFSDIIGSSHSPQYTMWENGGFASEGVKQVAEWGSTRKLESELKGESNRIRTIIKARGLWYPNVNGKTFAVFRVDKLNHVISLISMLGPSPDWIVGLSKQELCLRNCSWITSKTINLYPWDAGTDSGITYMSANSPTEPRDKIRRITTKTPANEQSPFYDVEAEEMKPLARIRIERQRLYEKPCDENPELGIVDETETDDFEDSLRPECAVTDWSDYSQCSVTCGKGLRMRTRDYLNKAKATMMGCERQLVEKEMCAAANPYCFNEEDESSGPGGDMTKAGPGGKCSVTKWSDWTDCSVTCGKGFRSRNRKYVDRMARKVCNVDLMEKDVCMGSVAECDGSSGGDPQCAVTQWSEWSPCTVTCGTGMKVRTRLYLNPQARVLCNVELMQKAPCMADRTDCTMDLAEAKEVCMQPREVGPCRGYFPRWYFDHGKRMCLQFIYGGCRGNRNNFDRYEDCNRMCEVMRVPIDQASSLFNGGSSSSVSVYGPRGSGGSPVDCVVTDWTEWSPCSATCGRGRMERQRIIKVHSQNNGKECPRKLRQRKKCNLRPCAQDCVVSAWSNWSECSKTCGADGIQQRHRTELETNKHGGEPCPPKLERRYCPLPPCDDSNVIGSSSDNRYFFRTYN